MKGKRSIGQNSKGWALWNDISKQVLWYGKELSPEHWKQLLSHDWRGQVLVPAIGEGFCALAVSTSKMNPREFSELIELTYAFGCQKGVEWSDKALEAYASYPESQKRRIN